MLISDFLRNLNLATISPKSLDFIFIVRYEFLSFMQFNLLVTSYDSLIKLLPALTLSRSFIILNTMA